MKNVDILYGMVLGDGYLDKPSKRRPTSRLTICQGIKQMGYLEHKSTLLASMGYENTIKVQKVYERSPLPSVQLRTRASIDWTQIRSELYMFRNTPDKYRKRITKNIVKRFSLKTLLYLYLDDGHNAKNGNGIVIMTMDFPYEEQEILRSWIYDLTGVEMKIWRRKELYYLACGKGSEVFKASLKTIFPNIECMEYKFTRYRE